MRGLLDQLINSRATRGNDDGVNPNESSSEGTKVFAKMITKTSDSKGAYPDWNLKRDVMTLAKF
jgi:hypothetical protein